MLARRVDQENAVHAQQTAGAAKSLNKGLGAKTPGNRAPKTPFKSNLHDENMFEGGKSGAKALGKKSENVLTLGKKTGQVNKSAFVTPAGPRTRPALGFKTTNAKATAFQTPGPGSAGPSTDKAKTLSPRLRRAKVKVHQEEAAEPAKEDDLEIEYMPPRPVPLLDLPSDDEIFGAGREIPQLSTKDFAKGWAEALLSPLTESKKADKLMDEILDKAVEDCFEDIEQSIQEELGISPKKKRDKVDTTLQTGPKTTKKARPAAPGTIMAKSAAAILSQEPAVSTGPSYAQSTIAAKSRGPSGGLFARKIRESAKAEQASAGRHEAALVASRSTLGYGKGRAVSQNLRKPVTAAFDHDLKKRSVSAGGPTSGRSPAQRSWEAEEALRMQSLQFEDDDLNDLCGSLRDTVVDEELEDFQLEVPASLT